MRLIGGEKVFTIKAVVRHWELHGFAGRLRCERLAKHCLQSLATSPKTEVT